MEQHSVCSNGGVRDEEPDESPSGPGVRFRQASLTRGDSSTPTSFQEGDRQTKGNGDQARKVNSYGSNSCSTDGPTLGPARGALPSLVADTLKRTAPYGLVQSANWALPSTTGGESSANRRREHFAPPILHSLVAGRRLGGSKSRQARTRLASEKAVPTLQQISHAEASVPKHLNLLYETCVSKSPAAANRHPTTAQGVTEEVEQLLTLQGKSENGAAQYQDLDETGHADLTKVRTEQDAVEFFARHGSTTKTKFLFCNRAPTDPLVFEPYKLVVVPYSQVNPEHFTISATSVMHICPGKPSECIRQDEWMRQAFVHSVLRSLPFFKTFVVRKVLSLWSHASRRHVFEQRRQMLCRTLFLAKPIYCDHLLQIHRVLAGVSSVKLVELQPVLYEISQFIAQQHALRSDPKTGTSKELEVSN